MNVKLFRNTSKVTKVTCLFACLLGVVFAYYALGQDAEYAPQTMVIIPDTVTGEGWVNHQNVSIQDTSGESIYQDFSLENAATLRALAPSFEDISADGNEAQDGGEAESSDEASEPAENIEVDAAGEDESEVPVEAPIVEVVEDSVEEIPQEEVPTEPAPEAPFEESAEETPPPVSIEEAPSAFDWKQNTFAFASRQILAQAIIDEPTADTEEPAAEPISEEVAETPPPVEEPPGEPVEAVEEAEEASPDFQQEVSPEEQAEEVVETETDTDSSESENQPEESVAADGEAAEEPSPAIVPRQTADSLSPCDVSAGCESAPMLISGFMVPEFDAAVTIDVAQLRLSLAAKLSSDAASDVQRIVVEYSYDGEVWELGQSIELEEEISNGLNGGYFLISMQRPPSLADLARLQVRLTYQGNASELEGLFVESAWLELVSDNFYEPPQDDETLDAIDYERELVLPTINEFVSPIEDFAADEPVSFELQYDMQKNLLAQLFTAVVGENEFKVEEVVIVDPHGNRTDLDALIEYGEDNKWVLEVARPPQKFLPGKYTVELTIDENERVFTDTFEFYWGVLAINTTKSMYEPGETATLNLAALTKRGDTICDADLRLQIVSPSGTITDVPVEQSGSCGPNNVTDVPDYLATFAETADVGSYEMQLSHYNISGNLVHKVSDRFEVREYVPYVIERTAPTRIYPPAPYEVKITIDAMRTFSGPITERLPQGFVVFDASDGATLTTLDEYNVLTWENITLEEGEQKTLTYRFDAPDISPYLYLLGPLELDGFKESRQWQIASDALGGVAWLTGFQTDSGTDLNAGASRMLWSTSTVDGLYFSHATSSESYKLTVEQAGDYFVAVTVPQQRTDANSSRTRIGAEVRVNGVAVANGLGRSGYIRNTQGHSESSSQVSFMLNDLAADDYVEVYLEGLTTIDAGDNVLISGQAGLYVEHIAAAENIFYATTTRTASSTNLNGAVASALQWGEIQEDSGFVHSDSVNSQNITLSNAGNYFVSISIPLSSAVDQQSVLGRVRLNGVQIPSGIFAQGYARDTGTESDGDSSIHWSGVVVATTSNMVLTVTTEQEAAAGTVTVTTGFSGSIYIQELPSSDVIVLRGTDLSAGTDWSDTPAESVLWNRQDVYDTTTFTHSTTTNSDDIVVDEAGDYFLVYNDAMTSATGRSNNRITVTVDGTAVSGAQTKSHYVRNQSGHNNSSASLIYLLTGLTAGQTINILSEQEGNAATIDDTASATVMLWKKAELNIQPDVPTFYDTPFDNIQFSSTTPYFDFSATDPDGTSDIQYEISWSTSTSFIASTTKVSGVDSGFSNTASTTDTSPFVEGNRIRYQIQSGDALTPNTTYYWRVRARDATGSGNFSDWSSAQSMTHLEGTDTPEWFQTFDDQFSTNVLTTTQVSGNNSVEVAVPENEEVLLVYAESTNTTLQYRLWDGTNLGIETSALDVGGVINWVVSAAGTTRDEYVVGTLDNSNDVNFMVFNRASTTWGNLVEFTTGVSNVARRGLAVAYETGSGEAVAVSCDGDADPSYRVWNGTSWYATGTINVSSANNCELITMAADPTSNEIVIVVRDTGAQYEAQVWNGDTNTWGDAQVLGSMAVGDEVKEGLSVAYESSGNQAMVVTTNAGNNNFLWNTWNGTSWGGINSTQALQNDFENGRLAVDPESDRITLCYIDEDADIGAITWDGDAWLTPLTEFTGTGNDDRGRAIDCEYEMLAGRDDYIIAAYGDTGTDGDYHAVYNASSWTGNLVGSDMNDAFWVQTERAGNGTVLALHFDDETDDIDFSYWNGTSWASHDTIEDTPSSVATPNYETGSMAARKYVAETGTVRSQPIRHSAVPNQPTWGDLYFNTTETLGTNVTLKLYYSSTTACDTVIPNAALAGNETGFDVSASPINISGLSTTTYDEICLEATLTQVGGTSPTLDDWRVTWERRPFLTQNAYRWYVNGSFLTPLDVWPLGVSDLAENIPIDSASPVDLGEEVRLRMSINNENVLFATSTDTFKLQYGLGASCPAVTSWQDVGAIGSTTAAWRGYANSIVGSDWYNGSWSRRIKMTIDNSVVPGSVTDFPVYVDLADLPASFFSTVQSDGDDIRITSSDGVTELPFELVSISTGSNSGELHFKANLSSTTDSEFYIYYGNGSASGYAPTATYGSRNVWTNSFSLRYALDDNPAGGSPQFLDSTSNGNNAVARAGMTSGDVVAGQIGSSTNLDGNDGGVFQSALAYAGTFSISFWMRSQNLVDSEGFMVAGPAGANEKFGTWTSNNFFTRVISSSDTGVAAPADNSWAHIFLTRDSSNKVDLYVNGGAANRLYADVAQSGTSDWENFGGETTQGFEGDMDELRFASARRDAGWIGVEYNNQSNPTGFYSLSGEELMSDGRRIPSTLLSVSDVAQTYEEQNPTALNFGSIPVGADAEWDFVLENNNASTSSEYCFRLTYSDGEPLDDYDDYPKLTTNAPPPAPALSAPFDNEKVASSSAFFEFSADDVAGDEVTYQIQIDDDNTFTSTTYDQASDVNGLQFENIVVPSDKDPFTTGQVVRYIPPSGIATGTYWWRVRAKDPSGSNSYGAWSTAYSFTIDTTITATTWFQTTGEQFDTNALEDATSSPSTDDLSIASGFTNATVTSTGVDFDDGDTTFGNAWGAFTFTDTETSSDLKYALEYRVSGDTWALIPDSALSGNSTGFDTSPVSLITLDTTIYNELRIRALMTDAGSSPRLLDWTISWGYRVSQPTLDDPFDNAKVATVTPTFTFVTTDPEGDVLEYEFSISTTTDFAASTTFNSGSSGGFLNAVNGGDTDPFNSGETISFTLPGANALVSSTTYWWRVRARDPLQSGLFSLWSDPQSFTVDESIATSVWFQTTGEQFRTNTLTDIEGNIALNQAEITTTLREVMTAYGEGTVQSPRYRIWDGTAWGSELTAESVGAQIEQTVLKASPTRNEYALGTVGTDGDMNVQVYDGSSGVWGDQAELVLATNDANMRSFDLAYENTSGDLMAVSCNGTEAVYRIWNGTTWSATSSIALTNVNNCLWVKLASDPVSDEIIAVFRHTNTGLDDFEAQVWNGSSWGNAAQFGELAENAHEGMTVAYEASGGQALVVVSDNLNPSFLFNSWNGSAWSGTSTHTLPNDFEWGELVADVGTDNLVLCYIDEDSDLGIVRWTGTAPWQSAQEFETLGNTKLGRPISCQFETTSARDGYIMIPYSDDGAGGAGDGGKYQFYATSSLSGELDISTIGDSYNVISARGGDGVIHAVYLDDIADDYVFTNWDGTNWSTPEILDSSPSVTNLPFHESVAIAARKFPAFTDGTMRSTLIDFDDGTGPRWERLRFSATTPGSSSIRYQVYYNTGTSTVLVPDSQIPGNSVGFASSTVDISTLNKNTYNELYLEAAFTCVSGNCPVLNDWSVEWAEGIDISGNAYQYDGVTTVTSGTVAVAVNGVLQAGKTAAISGGGTWTIDNVTAFEGDTVLVFIDGATDAAESVAVARYDGVGDMTGLELSERHLTLGSNDAGSTTHSNLTGFDYTDDEDVFFGVSSNDLTLCADVGCHDARLKVKSSTLYQPGNGADALVHDFVNYGEYVPNGNTLRVSGSWFNYATVTAATSTIIFTATSSAESLVDASSTYHFYNVTFGETSGTASWTASTTLDVDGDFAVDRGTLARGTSTITIARNARISVGGAITGIATTTFDGSGTFTWTDNTASGTNLGRVVIDGTAKTISLASQVAAQSITIGADDTLSGGSFTAIVYGPWTNNGTFAAGTGAVAFNGTSTFSINRGSSAFNNLSFGGVNGIWAFTTQTLDINGNFSVATGTVTLPSATTTIAGSFLNTGGIFQHNNGTVVLSSSVAGRSITQSATNLYNAFYNLWFTGTGSWSYTESAATTTNTMRIQSGAVTFPSGTLTVGGDFVTTGGGSFAHNNGEVVFLVADYNTASANGSSFNNVRTRGAAGGSWYNESFERRIPVTISETAIDSDLTNFPVYVNLDDLPSDFFSNVQSDGDDIRVTLGDGLTEVPREVVSINTSLGTGEIYFKATSVSSTTNTTFYIYYGSTTASGYANNATYGAEAVWNNGYVLVEHLNDLTTSTVNNSEGIPDGTKTSAGNPQVVTTGKIYDAQDFSGDSIAHTDILGSQNQMSFSAWVNADDLTGSGDTATFGFTIFGISPAAAPYTWLTAGGTGFTDEFRFCAYSNSTTCTGTTDANITTGNWYYVSVTAVDGASTTVRVNGVQRASFTNPGDGTLGTNFTLGDLRPTRGINWDGRIDSVRVSNVVRSSAWQDAEYRNTATSSTFYSVGVAQQTDIRAFTDTNVTFVGSFNAETGGDARFPGGTLTIGGSFDNNASFDANSGTVLFNSSAGSETIAAGASSFATVTFNNAGGIFAVTEHATATTAINLTNVSSFTLNSGQSLTALGTFTNQASGTATTWTGSTLRLSSNTDYSINAKTHGGDTYGTLETTSDTDITMWNSSATSYVTASTSSIYSADHAAVDGDLNIYGQYERTTGTEHWSYATDFDGTTLGTSTSRQVDVRFANNATATFSGATLAILGTTTASTTINNQGSGTYAVSLTTSTINARNYEFTNLNSTGLALLSSTTVTSLREGRFVPTVSGGSGITVSSTTIDANPGLQIFNVAFATTSAISAFNVSQTGGTPVSFWWFRTGTDNLYGEAFDNDTGDPGSVRFDDSSLTISVSGTVYRDAGVTPLTGGTCDGVATSVRLVVENGATYNTTCSNINGTFTFPSVAIVGDPTVTIFLNDASGGEEAVLITKTPTTNITGADLYHNRLVLRHEDTAPMTIADINAFDTSFDDDLFFTAATGTPESLVVFGNRALYIAPQKTFAPGGNVTLYGNASSSPIDGSLYLGATSTLTLTATATLTIGGSIDVGANATITAASSTVYMNATTTGKTITATGGRTVAFNELQFTGVGGGWNINTAITAEDDIYVATGTVTGTGSITLNYGSFYGDGLVSLGGGTTTIARTNTLGGVQGWTFRSLTLGNGSTTGTTTPGSSATTTVSGVLTISTAHFLDANASSWNLSGTGTVFVESGTFLEDTSTVRYSGTAATNVRATDYYKLILDAAAGSPTYTALGPGVQVFDDLLVGLSNTTTVTFDTNDPALNVDGDFVIGSNGTFVASNSGAFTLAGSCDNNGTFTSSNGTLTLDGSGTRTIAAGNSSFATVVASSTGAITLTEHATATTAFTLTSAGSFTVNSGQQLAVGGTFTNNLAGGLTTWSGSTLYLYGGGNYSINGTSTSDSYETISVAANTQVRLWNSSASTTLTAAGASVYSQDHANVNGDLYIYGDYVKTSGTDHWSYATDFDGTTLSSSRVANVRIEGGGTLYYQGTAGLSVVGTTTGSTTVEVQGSGTYSALIGGTASTSWQYAVIRDTNSSGLTFTGTPSVSTLRNLDFLAESNGVTTMTVGGSVITANPAKNFLNMFFSAAGGVSGASNVTATGTTLSAWRFTAHQGDLDGEANDVDPGGDPGYLIWDDSASIITISGRVYQTDRTTRSTVCDGTTRNIVLAIDGSLLQNASSTCSAADGSYSISGVSFSASDVLTLFINDETENGVTVSVDPVSSISDMDIYENHVIIRHENTDPISIANMAVYDSSDDSDTIFTAVDAGTDTLTVPANNQIIVWGSKRFAPGGNVTLSGGGAGASYDGTLELFTNATFDGAPGETHSVGGNLTTATGAAVQVDTAGFTFTSSAASRTIDSNDTTFGNVTFNGSGSFTVTDTTFSTDDLTFTAGAVTLPSATTSIRGSLTTTGGSFINNGGAMDFTSSSTETITAGTSNFGAVYISGSGIFTMNDVNATATKSFRKTAGSLTLPSGTFSVGGSFENASGTLAHNTSEIVLATSSAAFLTASGSDLFAVRFTGGGTFTMTDTNLTLLDDLTITSGSLTLATGTLAVGGSWTTTGGTFAHASGTVLFNSTDGGETIAPGASNFNNVSVAGPTGGFTFTGNATTTGNFALTSANSFTVNSGVALSVQGVFTNAVGGASTTWTGSTLRLLSGTDYSLNTKTTGGDVYGTLEIAALMNLDAWNSSAATTTLLSTSTASLYSKDHAGTDGHLYVYGSLTHATGTLFWNYANDFDGTVLSGGSRRAVNVFFVTAASSSFAMSDGTLEIVGATGATTTVQAVGAGNYAFAISGGTLNAQYYAFRNQNAAGLTLTGTPTITTLSNGDFELSQNSGTLISVSSTTLSANASKIFQSVRFATSTGVTGTNVTLSGTTLSSWRFQGSYGAIGGESFDVDGIDACGSIRFDDSGCLLVEQTVYRWRHDDGGVGVPDSEWYNGSWTKRKSVQVDNNDATTYTDAVVKLTVLYDADMQADFDDLRFTTSDGTTLTPHFVASTTLSSSAEVWVKVPSLPASDTATLYMYYGNATASTTGSSSDTFIAAEDFEDGNISEYSGNTSLFAVDATFAYGGSYGLDNTGNENQKATDGIARFDQTVSQGETIRFEKYISTASGLGDGDEVCTLFAVQSPVTSNQNYALCLEQFGVDRMSIVRNAENTDSTGTRLASTTVTFATGWYTVEIDWRTNNTIFASLFNRAGALVATTSATDSTYTSGGLGFTYWFNYGGWDNYSSRPILTNEPNTRFGLEVSNGGASWAAAQGVKGVYTTNDIARLRVAIENSGLAIIDQNFDLEFAPKGAAPSCESVSDSSFTLVPNQASCGTSAICTQSTSYFTNGEATGDLLTGTAGTATPGQAIESPSNTTSDIDIDQNFFTEIEYALTPTSNASSTNYCFRVTDSSAALDSYLSVAELELSFGPQISALSLNGGLNITLTPGTTTTVFATGTVSDLNGYTNLSSATATIYRSGQGETCTTDNNNCYRVACSFTSCAGNSCTLSCPADIVYHAEPTDIGTYAGETWRAYAVVSDTGNATTSDFAPSIDMNTLNALTLDGSSVISYGSLEVGTSTEGYNATTTVENIGNGNIDVSLQGTNLTDGGASTIAVNQQRFATSTFAYSSCGFCSTLATTTTPVEIDLFKPTSTSSPVLADIYWGIAIPFGTAATAHQGLNTFYAVTD